MPLLGYINSRVFKEGWMRTVSSTLSAMEIYPSEWNCMWNADLISSEALVHSSFERIGGQTLTFIRGSCSMKFLETRFFRSGLRLIMAISELRLRNAVRAAPAKQLVVEVALDSCTSHFVEAVHVQLNGIVGYLSHKR